jgi:integrase/recombinase XerD
MPSNLAAVIKRIDVSLTNARNRNLIYRFVDFMKSADITERYQKDNLFVILLYGRHLGDKELSNVDCRDDIINFLDTRKKDTTTDPDQKWIRTWNDYLQRIKYFMRWLHNGPPFLHRNGRLLHLHR